MCIAGRLLFGGPVNGQSFIQVLDNVSGVFGLRDDYRVDASVDFAQHVVGLTLRISDREADALSNDGLILSEADLPMFDGGFFTLAPRGEEFQLSGLQISIVPEPGTLCLLGAGALALLRARRGKRRRMASLVWIGAILCLGATPEIRAQWTRGPVLIGCHAHAGGRVHVRCATDARCIMPHADSYPLVAAPGEIFSDFFLDGPHTPHRLPKRVIQNVRANGASVSMSPDRGDTASGSLRTVRCVGARCMG